MANVVIARVVLVPFLCGCAASAVASAPSPAEKFRLATADGQNELELGALVQVLGRLDDEARDPRADFDLKRVRPEISGRLAGGLAFNLEPNFSEDEVELEEAWIGHGHGHGHGGEEREISSSRRRCRAPAR